MTSLSQELRWAEDPDIRSRAASLLPGASEVANDPVIQALAGKAGKASIVLGFLTDLANGDSVNQAIIDGSGDFLSAVTGGGIAEAGCGAAGVATDGLAILACGVGGSLVGSLAWEYVIKPRLNRALVGG